MRQTLNQRQALKHAGKQSKKMETQRNKRKSNVTYAIAATILLVAIVLLFNTGCEIVAQKDDAGNVVKQQYQPNAKTDEIIGKVTDTVDTVGPPAIAVTTAINPLWGNLLAGIIGIAASFGVAYNKWKIPLTKITAGAVATATALDKYVKPTGVMEKGQPMNTELKAAENAGAIMPNKIKSV